MRRTTILFVAAVALPTVSCHQSARTPKPTPEASASRSRSPTPSPSASASSAWNAYTNTRFNYALIVPPGFTADDAPTNNDGRVFQDGDATLRVFGAHNVLDSSFADQIDQASEGLSDVTVATRTADRWRASATTSDGWKVHILLLRPSQSELVTARFSYPKHRSTDFGAMAERSLDSLKAVG